MPYQFFSCSANNKHATWATRHRKWQLPHVTWHCLAVGWGRPGWLLAFAWHSPFQNTSAWKMTCFNHQIATASVLCARWLLLPNSRSLGFSQPTILLQARCLPVHINAEVRVQLSRLGLWMFLCADYESDGKTGQPVPKCMILPSNTSTPRQITEHVDFRE